MCVSLIKHMWFMAINSISQDYVMDMMAETKLSSRISVYSCKDIQALHALRM